jgi:DNA polymerase III subunit alpha
VSTPFVHLHLHSEYSLSDGIVRIDELVSAAAAARMPAVALTDLANLFGAVKFFQKAVKAGVQPILGSDVWLENSADRNKPYRLVLLCQNRQGYLNLNQMLTRAYTEGQHAGRPCIQREWFTGHSDGLLALSGALDGDIGQALVGGHQEVAERLAREYQQWFPQRFYIELQRTGHPLQEECVHASVALAARVGMPVVATNPVQFLKADEFEAHEVRVCIQDSRILTDTRRPRLYTPEQYFRSAEEMADLFQDIPEALANTIEIARRCNFRLDLGRYFLPDFPLPPGQNAEQVLRANASAGLAERLRRIDPDNDPARRQQYEDRLKLELGVVIQMGFSGYFLIVADFIQWARANDVPVGPGRGSGAGSLVAFVLGITALDPIQYDLLFERFLNPERVSLPDFDVDFCIEGRDRVIEYVTRKYGQERVSQIITHGTMAAKAVVRDVGRVLDHPYGYVDKIAKLVPHELEMTLDKALEQEPLLRERYENEEDVRVLIDTAKTLEGLARNAGKHAAGVVIAPSALTDFMPLYCEQGSHQFVTQYDMKDVETMGLVKFDFLGLRNLTIIDRAVKMVNPQRAREGLAPIVIDELPLDDAPTFQLLKSCRTTALFQLESRGMKELIQRLQPDNFEEIVALVALFRPGPLQSGMVDDFINRKHGRARIKYPHPSLEPILKPTYGVILYQEQVMQIAQVLSGYTLGGADLLRRAMGKKKPEEMAQQRSVFVQGAEGRGVNGKLAADIFDLIEKFAGYGFNRSHSAAYALIAYQTAWLKTHYPAAFMAAVLSADMDKTDKVVTMIAECRDMKINVLPPDINRCEYGFVVLDDDAQGSASAAEGRTPGAADAQGCASVPHMDVPMPRAQDAQERPAGGRTPGATESILYGLGAIKGLGQAAIDAILDVRRAGGLFSDLFDFCRRIDLRRVNRRVLESLIKAGALDGLGMQHAQKRSVEDTTPGREEVEPRREQWPRTSRSTLMASLSLALAAAEQVGRAQDARQDDMFGLGGGESTASAPPAAVFVEVPPWSEELRLEGEKETLGLYLTGHPIARYEQELARFIDSTIAELKPTEDKNIVVAGLVVGMRAMQTRRGDRMAFVTLDDRTGRLELAVFSELYERHRDLLAKDTLLVVEGQVSMDEYSGGFKMSAERIYNIDQARGTFSSRLEIDVDAALAATGFLQALQQVLKPATPGACLVCIRYDAGPACAEIVLGPEWKITPGGALLDRLTGLAGEGRVRLIYPDTRRVLTPVASASRRGRSDHHHRSGASVSFA